MNVNQIAIDRQSPQEAFVENLLEHGSWKVAIIDWYGSLKIIMISSSLVRLSVVSLAILTHYEPLLALEQVTTTSCASVGFNPSSILT